MRFIPLIFLLAIEVAVARPIEIEVGRGRNGDVVKLVDQAQEQLFKDDLAGARRSVDAAIQADPTYWPALYIRAEVLIQQRQYEAAIQDCGRILQQDSTVVEAALLRAEANYFSGRCAASMKEVQHCITIRPRQDPLARAFNSRALLHLDCADPSLPSPLTTVSYASTAVKVVDNTHGRG